MTKIYALATLIGIAVMIIAFVGLQIEARLSAQREE